MHMYMYAFVYVCFYNTVYMCTPIHKHIYTQFTLLLEFKWNMDFREQ